MTLAGHIGKPDRPSCVPLCVKGFLLLRLLGLYPIAVDSSCNSI